MSVASCSLFFDHFTANFPRSPANLGQSLNLLLLSSQSRRDPPPTDGFPTVSRDAHPFQIRFSRFGREVRTSEGLPLALEGTS
jgi:hypothetical protein